MFYFVGGVLLWYLIIFVYKTKTGSPSIMSKRSHVAGLLKYVKPGSVVADMGCGDAQVLIGAVRAGASAAEGWELEPLVWLKAKLEVKRKGLGDTIKVHFGDMWGANLSSFDLVYVYQLTRYSRRFVNKCRSEMKKGSMVVANTYPLDGLTLINRDKELYIYMI